MDKQILLINDLPGFGKVALSAMVPILSKLGHKTCNLPTALVSNTLDYGKFEILETTGYMHNTISVWEQLGFFFYAVSTGFIVSERQAKLVADYCREQKKRGGMIFTDPIMGDEGSLYNGITEHVIQYMKQLVGTADYIVPNYTEAACLAGTEYKKNGLTFSEAGQLVKRLHEMGACNVIVTSAKVEGQDAVIVYDGIEKQIRVLPFTPVPVRFPGTGDIFSSIFMDRILRGKDVFTSTQDAMDCVRNMILAYRDFPDKYQGIPVEKLREDMLR